MRRSLLLSHLEGAPFALPSILDRASERWWARSPRTRFVLVGSALALAVLAGLSHAAATPYGPPSTVHVATRDLPIGHEVSPGDLRRADWPLELIPADATTDPGGRLTAPLPAGAVLTDGHLGSGGIAGLLPPGTVGVPLPTGSIPALTPGQRVDVVGRDVQGVGLVLARGARVIAVEAEEVWLAVTRESAPDVAAAAPTGTVSVVVLAP